MVSVSSMLAPSRMARLANETPHAHKVQNLPESQNASYKGLLSTQNSKLAMSCSPFPRLYFGGTFSGLLPHLRKWKRLGEMK
jgi:hypothetical protein